MSFKIPNSIRDPKDLINLLRDEETKLNAKEIYGNLPKEPEAHIATNAQPVPLNPDGSERTPNQEKYFFYKVYVQGFDQGTINIYDGINRSTQEVGFIISGYKTAYYKGTHGGRRPSANEVWSCEFKTENSTLGSIEIKSFIRKTDERIVRQNGSVRNNGGRDPFNQNNGQQPLGRPFQPPLPTDPNPQQPPANPSSNSSIVIDPRPTTFAALNDPPHIGETAGKYTDEQYEKWTKSFDPNRYNRFDNLILSASAAYSVSASLIKAIIWSESSFNPTAGSSAKARGLMQLMEGTADDLGVTNRDDPAQNIDGGTRYIKKQLNRFSGDVELALASYNWGPGNVRSGLSTTSASTFWEMADRRGRYNNGNPKVPEETQGYVRKVSIRYEYFLHDYNRWWKN